MITYERETLEFQAVVVKLDGVVTTAGIQFAITTTSERPATWLAPVELDGKTGVMIEDLDPGYYYIWVKVTDNPEIPVKNCGRIRVV